MSPTEMQAGLQERLPRNPYFCRFSTIRNALILEADFEPMARYNQWMNAQLYAGPRS